MSAAFPVSLEGRGGKRNAELLVEEIEQCFGRDLFACLRYVESRLDECDGEIAPGLSFSEWFLRIVAECDRLRDRGLLDPYRGPADDLRYARYLAGRRAP